MMRGGTIIIPIKKASWLGWLFNGAPKGSRTPVAAVKGRCPRPLDDGDVLRLSLGLTKTITICRVAVTTML